MKSHIRKLGFLFSLLAVGFSSEASAYTECTLGVQKVFAGDNGFLWLFFQNGGSAVVSPSAPDLPAMTALGITALAGGRTVTIRYNASSVDCAAAARSDVIGLFLN